MDKSFFDSNNYEEDITDRLHVEKLTEVLSILSVLRNMNKICTHTYTR